MIKILHDLLTGPDNQTHELVNWAAMLGYLTGIGLSIAHYAEHGVFDVQGFMTGFGIGIAALGVALRARDGVPLSKLP